MAYLNKKLPSFPPPSKPLLQIFLFTNLFLLLSHLPPLINALNFNFPSFASNQTDIKLQEDAKFYDATLFLTRNPLYGTLRDSVGRALYHKAMQLWDVNGSTTILASFTTHFSFKISNVSDKTGHGLAFFLVPENDDWHPNRTLGKYLGLFESEESAEYYTKENHVVAVEIDTLLNRYDKSKYHFGIDQNSIESKAYVNLTDEFMNSTADVWVNYNSTTKNLSASFTFDGSLIVYNVSYITDLSLVLPQRVQVGFSAATGINVEINELYSWSFNSSLDDAVLPSPSPPRGKNKVGLVVGVTVGLFVLLLACVLALYWTRSRRNALDQQAHFGESPLIPSREDQQVSPESPRIEYQGPVRFSYHELSKATNKFDKELKLGEGGFGDVFEGTLASSNEKVALKRFRSGSSQSEKEYVSEVNIISKLKHKSLVQLKGWCHENGELLLAYEFMTNRSLDFHLFGKNMPLLTWPTRYKIAIDLASALHYLQDGCDPFVLHRDIKSSNIMLDSNFNAKLGDFGLARFTTQDKSFKTTVPAGTLGYLAPEVITGIKASKASDIYSFGVVALEIASGRRPVSNQSKEDSSKLNLVEWVWDWYGKGSILDAVDVRLNGEFDKDEARRLMVVGLWCCHPDPDHRPSIRQVETMLNFEAAEPSLPPTIPRPIYVSSNMNMSLLSSNETMDSESGSSARESRTTSGTIVTH